MSTTPTWHALVVDNIDLVHWTVERFARHLVSERDEIVADGMLGLIHAAQRFDPGRGLRFSPYAVRCIRGYILIGYNNRSRNTSVRRGRGSRHVSLDDVVPGGEDRTYEGVLPAAHDTEQLAIDAALGAQLARAVDRLPAALRPFLPAATGECLSAELARDLSVSPGIVRQGRTRVIQWLRAEMGVEVDDIPHGAAGYRLGCTCAVCRADAAEARYVRARSREAVA